MDDATADDGSKPAALEMSFWHCRLRSTLGSLEGDGSSASQCTGYNSAALDYSWSSYAAPVLTATP